MDRGELIVEATITGSKGYYDCPVRLRLYGPEDLQTQATLKQRMKASRFPASALAGDPPTNGINRSAAAGAIEVQPYDNHPAQFAATPSQAVDMGPSLTDIIGSSEQFNPRLADQIVEQFGTKEEDLVRQLAPSSGGILTVTGCFAESCTTGCHSHQASRLPTPRSALAAR